LRIFAPVSPHVKEIHSGNAINAENAIYLAGSRRKKSFHENDPFS
tara:strand:+ start:313 stop:447 length:135 start_codon:yes stop_codon:yes gene_type:complete